MAEALNKEFHPLFSKQSYCFRPNNRGHDAVRQAKRYIKVGNRWVVDINLEKFFDKVKNDRLMRILSFRIDDPKVLQLIRRYLQSVVIEKGLFSRNTEILIKGNRSASFIKYRFR
ncbi:hypothetical protein LPC09_26190 (plasmid) [Metabacillus sp. B2-18]|uniref:reverse transcriptase domain-containing protein n=1 Tax=Bacillaceae TaxID=186817 RepID=UPI001E627525|nr:MULTISPECIES: reverse transcriptase domain-containing protein [Bacillaceae]MCM3164313.1 reverse transcriptase domain-containing protein [Metabacillus litoralis]UGB33778.1 hypothetical protein LPC09_26190 [Metabacillus sp. B2-18]